MSQYLASRLLEINNFILDKNDAVYIDYPLYFNVGDLLIMHGTVKFFQENNIKIRLSMCSRNFSIFKLKRKITDKTTIFLNGGGNFGDLYMTHQNLREKVLKNFPNNRIILLPQSVHFENEQNLNKSKKIFLQHKNLILFARDVVSYEILSQFSTNTYLMPDMAHSLYSYLPKKKNQTGNSLYFLRKDKEYSLQQTELLKQSPIEYIDWKDLITKEDHIRQRCLKKKIKISKFFPFLFNENEVFNEWLLATDIIIKRVSDYYLSYDHIYTSRLHGHILASLLEIPSTIIDNSYKKNSRYLSQWNSTFNNATIL